MVAGPNLTTGPGEALPPLSPIGLGAWAKATGGDVPAALLDAELARPGAQLQALHVAASAVDVVMRPVVERIRAVLGAAYARPERAPHTVALG